MARASIIPVFIPHLGCPNDCVFCNQRAIAAPHVPSAVEVRRQVEEALLQCGQPAAVAFYGGSFTAIDPGLQTEYLEAVGGLIQDGRLAGVRISTRPDCIDRETLDRLEAGHVHTIELGAQSMDDGILARSGRGHTAAHTAEAAQWISGRFALVLQMMVGLPGSSPQGDLKTAEALAALRPDGVRIYPTCVLKGTALENMMRRGEYTPLTVEEAVARCEPVFDVFARQSIPVIRLGLNPTDSLEGEIIAGPYHPAMGELVRGRRLRRLACALLNDLPPGRATLSLPKGKAPLLRGQKSCNMDYFKEAYPHLEITVTETADQLAEIALLTFESI